MMRHFDALVFAVTVFELVVTLEVVVGLLIEGFRLRIWTVKVIKVIVVFTDLQRCLDTWITYTLCSIKISFEK